jgi:hypothetical protein
VKREAWWRDWRRLGKRVAGCVLVVVVVVGQRDGVGRPDKMQNPVRQQTPLDSDQTAFFQPKVSGVDGNADDADRGKRERRRRASKIDGSNNFLVASAGAEGCQDPAPMTCPRRLLLFNPKLGRILEACSPSSGCLPAIHHVSPPAINSRQGWLRDTGQAACR